MLKDRLQKKQLLQYFLSRNWYPQLEVDVIYNRGTLSKPKMITDIDVLSLASSNSGVLSPIIGDCKTLKSQSPINRAFWIKGIMDLFHSDFGIILLSKSIESDHKLLANDLGVSLFEEEDFKIYSLVNKETDIANNSALSRMECWDKYFELPDKFPNLVSLFWYCKCRFWNENNFEVRIRHCITELLKAQHELDPDNNNNTFVFLELSSLFAIAINDLTIKTFNKFLLPQKKEQFEEELRILVWGGYDNYVFLNGVNMRLASKGNESALAFPEWSMFINLIRSSLEKPLSTSLTPLILKELAFQFLVDQTTFFNETQYLEYLLKRDPIAAKNAIMIIDYLTKAAKLPPEFAEKTNSFLMKLQRN